MRFPPRLLILCACALTTLALLSSPCLCAPEELPLEEHYDDEPAFPPQAKITLQLPIIAMIGEEIPAKLLVHNTGGSAIKIGFGGDYRSTGYPWRMKVRVRDSTGQLLTVLPQEAFGMGGGGLMGQKEILSGATEGIEFPLECYVSFASPGIYTVIAGHDLGWKLDKTRPQPAAQATLIVTEPNAAQAAAHVKRIFDAQPAAPPRDDSDKFVREMTLGRKLCVLRHPIYLSALQERAAAGSVAAVKGLGHIATPDATRALLGLLAHDSPEIIQATLQQLTRRIPSPDDPAKPASWGSSCYQIEALLPGAWQPGFNQPLLASARQLLSRSETPTIEAVTTIFYFRGEPRDASPLLALLQRSLELPDEPQSGPKANTLDSPRPQRSLIAALDAIRSRGWHLEGPGDTAHTIAWYRQLADKDLPKPEGNSWQDSMLSSVERGPSALRMAALEAIPQPPSDEAAKVILKALEDPDWRIIRVACEAAGKSKRAEFARPLCQVLEKVPETFVQHAAHHAAISCGARMELWHAWANIIADEHRMSDAVGALVRGTIDLPPSHGSSGNSNFTPQQRLAIQNGWRAFLRKHESQLAAGQKVRPPDKKTTAALTGSIYSPRSPAFQAQLKDGSQWPAAAPK